MIRVVHVIWSASIGGIEKVVIDLITRQKKNPELEVSLLVGKSGGDFSRINAENIKVTSLGLTGGSDVSPFCYRKAKNIFRNCNIIHIHSFNPLLAVAASNSGTKIIYTEHGNFGIGKKRSWTDGLLTSLQKRFLNSSVDIITFNSEFSKETAEKKYGLKKAKKVIIYNGISLEITETEKPQDLEEQLKGHFVIGTVARFAGVKRIDRLLHVYAHFCKNKNTRLLLIGDGPLMDEMKQLAASLDIERSTIFAGYRTDARQCLSLMDVFALTSEQEAFGLVVVEAWDAGKPTVVYSDAGGPVELVQEVETANVAETEQQFAERLEYYYNNRNEINSENRKERLKTMAKNFSIEIMEQKFFAVYKE
jgi:L-malate glycosyltransferase